MSEPVRVMLADDQALFRSGIAVIIDAQPDLVVVGQASNGLQAVELAGRCRPDVILMDVRMPRMDGVEATRRIIEARVGEAPRIVMLTTFGFDDAARAAISHGASGFLLKDGTPDFLCATIREVHAGQRVVAPGDLGALFARPAHTADPDALASFGQLTQRETGVLRHVVAGMSNAEIAASMHLSESTVKTHLSSLLLKLGVRDRVQAVVLAYRSGVADQLG